MMTPEYITHQTFPGLYMHLAPGSRDCAPSDLRPGHHDVARNVAELGADLLAIPC